jgi:uncharacterized protein (DUF486 family)
LAGTDPTTPLLSSNNAFLSSFWYSFALAVARPLVIAIDTTSPIMDFLNFIFAPPDDTIPIIYLIDHMFPILM